MTSTVGEFVKKIDRAAKVIPEGTKKGVFDSALVLTTSIRTFLAKADKGNPKLRSASTGGSRTLGVGFDVKGTGDEAHALIHTRGAFQIIERDTSAHEITGRRGTLTKTGRTRNTGARALQIGQSFYARVSVSGSKGQHPFDRGIQAAQPGAVLAFGRAFSSKWAKALS